MKTDQIEFSLLNNNNIHAFRSGGGLRVLAGDLCGYGEHPCFEEAMRIFNDDILAGGRNYQDVYGEDKLETHYLTGQTAFTSNIDLWLLGGNSFDMSFKDDNFIWHSKFKASIQTPKGVDYEVIHNGEIIAWSYKKNTYMTVRTYHNGNPCSSTKCTYQGEQDAWFYNEEYIFKAKTLDDLLKEVESNL